MISVMSKRKYTLGKRAEQQDETRQRIVEATMALHEELGPARTTISAIAERAGVQRLTVYRHFPDEQALFGACTSTWAARHPWPPLPEPDARAQPEPFTARALQALYAHYRGVRGMLEVSYRDLDLVPAIRPVMDERQRYLDAYRDALVAAWAAPAGRRNALRATLGLAVRFQSWQALAHQGLSDAAMAALAARWAAAAARA
jgi:AcrR family transcriptional regulator